jgi:hypothetical protein
MNNQLSTHTLTISRLDDFEADHLSEILGEYRKKIMFEKLKALALNDQPRLDWFETHLAWHESIMKKVVWTKE